MGGYLGCLGIVVGDGSSEGLALNLDVVFAGLDLAGPVGNIGDVDVGILAFGAPSIGVDVVVVGLDDALLGGHDAEVGGDVGVGIVELEVLDGKVAEGGAVGDGGGADVLREVDDLFEVLDEGGLGLGTGGPSSEEEGEEDEGFV